ncbi:MAG: ankyrin repeat domain-containing protein [Planctomycetota bacterium]
MKAEKPIRERAVHAMDDMLKLTLAVQEGDELLVEAMFIANPSLVSARFEGGQTPLMLVLSAEEIVEEKKAPLVKELIELGSDVQTTDYEGMAPVHYVRDLGSARRLLEAGADAHAVDNEGWSVLHHAENVELAKLFLGVGVDLEGLSSEDESPLMAAAQIGGSRELVKYYLSLGAEANRVYPADGEADILRAKSILAMALPDVEKVKALLEHGADPHLKGDGGRSALEEARYQVENPDVDDEEFEDDWEDEEGDGEEDGKGEDDESPGVTYLREMDAEFDRRMGEFESEHKNWREQAMKELDAAAEKETSDYKECLELLERVARER